MSTETDADVVLETRAQCQTRKMIMFETVLRQTLKQFETHTNIKFYTRLETIFETHFETNAKRESS